MEYAPSVPSDIGYRGKGTAVNDWAVSNGFYDV